MMQSALYCGLKLCLVVCSTTYVKADVQGHHQFKELHFLNLTEIVPVLSPMKQYVFVLLICP